MGPLLVTCALSLGLAPAPRLTVELHHARIRVGHSAELTGSLSPARSGTFVELQGRRADRWRGVARAELRLSNRFSFTIRGRATGTFRYRVTGAGASSEPVTLTVTG